MEYMFIVREVYRENQTHSSALYARFTRVGKSHRAYNNRKSDVVYLIKLSKALRAVNFEGIAMQTNYTLNTYR